MLISKKALLSVNDLELSSQINQMNTAQFHKYCETLDLFIESLPTHEAALKKSLAHRDFNSLSKALSSVLDLLISIHATYLAQSCVKLLSEAHTTKYEVTEAHLIYFLTALSTLSIDIQMAGHTSESLKNTESASPETSGVVTKGNRQKMILAVDDASLSLSLLKSILTDSPYKFFGLTSGKSTLAFLQDHTPDLFILDIEMPEMDGYTLAKHIRNRRLTAPIIFLTGNATKECVIKAFQAGADDFIVKPLNQYHVLDKIQKHIEIG